MRRITAIAALAAALALGACGSDDEGSNPATTQGSGATTETTTATTPATSGQTPTAPASATDPSTGAPDEGISTRPGGPESGGGGY